MAQPSSSYARVANRTLALPCPASPGRHGIVARVGQRLNVGNRIPNALTGPEQHREGILQHACGISGARRRTRETRRRMGAPPVSAGRSHILCGPYAPAFRGWKRELSFQNPCTAATIERGAGRDPPSAQTARLRLAPESTRSDRGPSGCPPYPRRRTQPEAHALAPAEHNSVGGHCRRLNFPELCLTPTPSPAPAPTAPRPSAATACGSSRTARRGSRAGGACTSTCSMRPRRRAVFAHQLGHDADAAAEGDHGEDGLVAVDLRVDLGAGGLRCSSQASMRSRSRPRRGRITGRPFQWLPPSCARRASSSSELGAMNDELGVGQAHEAQLGGGAVGLGDHGQVDLVVLEALHAARGVRGAELQVNAGVASATAGEELGQARSGRP